MTDVLWEPRYYPFVAFNFRVEITIPGVSPTLCDAAFSECDGLELTHDVKTVREGGNNTAQIRMTGTTSMGNLTLKRGMTSSFHLWDWFDAVQNDPRLRAHGEVVLLGENRNTVRARFILERCLPLKLKAPPLNAKDGMVAVEELQVAYESLRLKRPA
jgi:phage tail-like protein